MSIFRVSINIATASLGREELDGFAGQPGSRWAPIGQPISTFDPTGPTREISQWHLDSGLADDTDLLEPHFEILRPVLERFAAGHPSGVLYASLSIALTARTSGFVFEVEPADAALVARAGLHLRVDAYAPEA